MQRKTSIRIGILLVVKILVAYSCVTVDDSLNTSVATETFEATSYDGVCYQVTLVRMSDNSISFTKRQKECGEGFSTRIGVYDTRKSEIGKLVKGDSQYWYIPFDGPPQRIPGEPTIECFCEEQMGEPCNGQGGCYLTGGGKWVWCAADICCNDCDARICIDTRCIPVGTGGVLVNASRVFVESATGPTEREESGEIYYGNNVRIEITQSGSSIIAHRSLLGQNMAYPPMLFNRTTLVPDGEGLNQPANGLHWFIPFEIGISARSIYGHVPHCVSDGCKTECDMVTGTSGCLECKCTGIGDCDLEPAYSSGGILVETQNLQVIDN